jgi:hypothetical protein
MGRTTQGVAHIVRISVRCGAVNALSLELIRALPFPFYGSRMIR